MNEQTITERVEAVSKSKDVQMLLDMIDAYQAQKDKDRYWSIDEIAQYLGVSTTTVARNFISDPRFPRAIKSSRGANGAKRWLGSEVKKAIILFRE